MMSPSRRSFGRVSMIQIKREQITKTGLLAILAAWRYHKVNLAIERGQVTADRGLVLVTVIVGALAIVMIVYMLITAGQP